MFFYLAFFAKSLATGDFIAPSDSLDLGLAAFLSKQSIWTDGMFSGYPVAADPQALMWYPLFRLLIAIGWGWNLFMILPYILASFGAFLLVYRLSSSALGALFAGLVYGFSTTMLVHMSHFNQIHVAAWAPFFLYGIAEIKAGNSLRGILVGSLALALMVLAGHPQEMVYTVYLTCAYIAYHILHDRISSRKKIQAATACVASLALGFALSAILLMPAKELASLGRRTERDFEERWDMFTDKSLPPLQLVTLSLPLSFGGFRTHTDAHVAWFGESSPGEMSGYFGFLPLCLALFGVWSLREHKSEALFWLGSGFIAILLALGEATPLARVAFHLPLYASFRAIARHLFIVALCFAVASGLVLSEVMTKRRWTVLWRSILYGALLGVGVAGILLLANPHARQLVYGDSTYRFWAFGIPALTALAAFIVAILALLFKLRAVIVAILLVFIQAADMFAIHYVYPGYRLDYAEVEKRMVTLHPQMQMLRDELQITGERALAADGSRNALLLPNLTRAWNVPSAGGNTAMGLKRYHDLLNMGGPGDIYAETLSGNHWGLDLLAVRYVLVPDVEVPEKHPFLTVNQLDHKRWESVERLSWDPNNPDYTYYWLVRNRRAMPRAWLVSKAIVLSREKILETIRTGRLPDGVPFSPDKFALLEPPHVDIREHETSEDRSCGVVTVMKRSETAREFLVETKYPCFLVLSEVFYPWWQARINGTPAELVRVDYALMGLPLPSGQSQVRIEIVPTSLYRGSAITCASSIFWMILFALAILHRRNKTRLPASSSR